MLRRSSVLAAWPGREIFMLGLCRGAAIRLAPLCNAQHFSWPPALVSRRAWCCMTAGPSSAVHRRSADDWRSVMLDGFVLAIGIGFFVAAILYTLACDKM